MSVCVWQLRAAVRRWGRRSARTRPFAAAFTLGAGWKTLSCWAGGSDAYRGITTMGPQLSGKCFAMSRHVLARASISSWPVINTKMSCDWGASCAQSNECHEQSSPCIDRHTGENMMSHRLLFHTVQRRRTQQIPHEWLNLEKKCVFVHSAAIKTWERFGHWLI